MVESKGMSEDEEWGKCFMAEVASLDNSIHHVEKEEKVVIERDDGEPIIFKDVQWVKKNLLSLVNAIDSGFYVLFGPKNVKFLKNIEELKAEVAHTGTRIENSESLRYIVPHDVVFDKGSSKIEEQVVLMENEKEKVQGERGSIDKEEGDAQHHGSMASHQARRNIVTPARIKDEGKREKAKKENMNVSKKNETWKLVQKSKHGKPTSYEGMNQIKRSVQERNNKFNSRSLTHRFSQKCKKNYDGSLGHVAKMKTYGRWVQNKYGKHLHFNVEGPPRDTPLKPMMIDKIKFKGEY